MTEAIRIQPFKRRRNERPFGLCEVCSDVLPDYVWRVAIPAELAYQGDSGWIVHECCSEACAQVHATAWAVSGGPLDGD